MKLPSKSANNHEAKKSMAGLREIRGKSCVHSPPLFSKPSKSSQSIDFFGVIV